MSSPPPAKRTRQRPSSPDQLLVRLDPEQLRQIAAAASKRGVEPAELARLWLEASLKLVGVDGSADATDVGSVREQVARIGEALTEQATRLEAIERLLLTPRGRAELAPAPIANVATGHRRPRRARAVTERRASTGAPTISLHDEIVDVLKRSNGPMSASDIADAVRRRGRYQAPRSAKPVNGAMISSRVSNPYYRDRFRHENRKITLAD